MLGGEIAPKQPNILNGTGLRILNPTAVRSALALGSMATQNSGSVSINGGNIQSVNINSAAIQNSNISNTSIYQGTISNTYVSNLSYLSVSGDTNINSRLFLSSAIYTSNANLGNEIVSYIKGSGGSICVGTPTNPCSSYSYGSCPSAIGCSPSEVYCPDYNGNQSGCEGYGCTYESVSYYCSDSSPSDEYSCTSQGGGGHCSWDGNYSDCSDFNGSQMSCEGTSGCSWTPANDCSYYYDESSCLSASMSCSWDGMNCSGGEISLAYCGGSYISSYSCNGSWNEYTGNCTGSGGYCGGSASCTSLSVGACTGYAGCSLQSGVQITIPQGVENQVRLIKNIDPGGTDVILTFTNPYQDNTTSKTLANFNDKMWLHYKRLGNDCAAYTDQSSCEAKSGCGWDSENSLCSGTWYDERWYDFT